MINPQELENVFQDYMQDLSAYTPDGIYDINLSILYDLGLLSADETIEEEGDLTHSFYVIESEEKLTLYNQKFIVWIVPQLLDEIPTTYTLIAMLDQEKPRLEMVFTTTGVYNHSNLVLRILEKYLSQIEENEEALCSLKPNPSLGE